MIIQNQSLETNTLRNVEKLGYPADYDNPFKFQADGNGRILGGQGIEPKIIENTYAKGNEPLLPKSISEQNSNNFDETAVQAQNVGQTTNYLPPT
jgi:hypothetical protein